MDSFDVAVIGSGGAGLCAAIEARRHERSTVIVEADDAVGGSTALSGGGVMAACSRVQRDAGVEDSIDAFYDRYMVTNRWAIEPSIARALCEGAGPAVDWLEELGVEFRLLPGSSAELTPRSHMAVGEGAKIVAALEREARSLGAEIRLGCRVSELEPTPEGWRVAADGQQVRAHSVVLATGGIARNRELLETWWPDVAAHGDATWTVSARTCMGDGLTLGQELGAAIVGQNQGLALISPGFAQNFDVVPPGWLVFVNREGLRYVDEMMPYSMLAETTRAQTESTGFAILDEKTRSSWPPTRTTHLGVVSRDWNSDSIADNAAAGRVIRTATIRELAEKAGIQPDALEATIATYNADCAEGHDSRFRKDPDWLWPVATPPFYAAAIRPSLIALTCCGLRIDADTRVIGTDGAPIHGLYAAGETTGNVMRQYGGTGNAIANAIVFGLRAGRSASESR